MEPVLQMNMSKLKQGTITKSESVLCKLFPGMAGESPEIHCFDKNKTTKLESVIRVKSMSLVEKHNQVPRVVKARYENYILIRSEGGRGTYMCTETREQRDEWYNQLRCLLDHSQAAGKNMGMRSRRNTENASSRPKQSTDPRVRLQDKVKTSPGTVQDIFKEELAQRVQTVRNKSEQVTDSEHQCCPRHHVERRHDEEPVYENMHIVTNLRQLHRDRDTSRQVLRETAALYSDFHKIASIQSHVPDEDVNKQNQEHRLSGTSVNSEEDSLERPLPLRSIEPRKEPVESSWPPSPSEDHEPSGIRDAAFKLELESSLSRRLSSGLRESAAKPEPEASLCLPSRKVGCVDESSGDPPAMEPLYQNTRSFPPKKHTRPGLPPEHQQGPPPLPPPRPKPGIESKARTLLREKLQESVELWIPKAVMMRHYPRLRAILDIDSILITGVPPELKTYLRVGDQLVMVNDQLLDSVEFALKCIKMSQSRNANVKLTVKRIPFGTVWEFDWRSRNKMDVGLSLKGPEITGMNPRIVEASQGLQSTDTAGLTTAGLRCNFAITEINFDPVDPLASTEEVWRMLDRAKPHIALVLHPVDFLEYLKHEEENTYESVR